MSISLNGQFGVSGIYYIQYMYTYIHMQPHTLHSQRNSAPKIPEKSVTILGQNN